MRESATQSGRERWWLAALAFAVAAAYMSLATWLGLRFVVDGRDLTLIFALVLELGFAALGFRLGAALEAQRWERHEATRGREHSEQLAAVEARLARSERLATLGQLAGTIAHEVRNPLAIIRTLVQNLSESGAEPAATRRTCQEVVEEVDRLARVTGALLDLARPLAVERAAVPAATILERTELLARRLLRERQVRLETREAGPTETCVDADSDLICQVLLGLLDNAACVTPAGGSIRLECRERDGAVEFAVCDRGPGVPEELRQRIFEPFFTTRADGSGLGLAVARQIVEAHDGRLELGPSEGGGARFAVWLSRTVAA